MNLASLVVMAVMGLIVGWRVHTSPYEAILGFGLLLFAYAFSWFTATVALALRTPESLNNIAAMVSFPLMFISNAFLDSSKLPTPLRVVAEWNPVSTITQARTRTPGQHQHRDEDLGRLAHPARRPSACWKRPGQGASAASAPLSQRRPTPRRL